MFERVLITGCGGMLGNAVHPYFKGRCREVLATDKVRTEPWLELWDIRDAARGAELFAAFRPDLVLHLAAETDLEYCEAHPEVAAAVNATATRDIAGMCEAAGIPIVYISTAGVFDGAQDVYTEADTPKPIMVYGQTKLDGEHHVRAVAHRHYVVRAGWMVGGGNAKDHKFVSKILDQIREGRTTIHAVDDKFGAPTYTHDFAMNLFALLESRQYGTYHMVCEGSGSRYDVAREIVRICGRDDIDVRPVDSTFFAQDYFAPRPRSEVMHNANLRALNLNIMRHWRVALAEYITREFPELVQARH